MYLSSIRFYLFSLLFSPIIVLGQMASTEESINLFSTDNLTSLQNYKNLKKGSDYNTADFDDILEELMETLEESDLFQESNFLWLDYHLISNLSNPPQNTKTIIPALGINYERHILSNLGARISIGTNWWEKEIILVSSTEQDFAELFRFEYWTVGLGLAWHFNVGEKIDPYLGYMYSYRRITANCECVSEKREVSTGDFYIGARYLLSEGIFASLELGRNGLGIINVGLGLKF